MRLPTRSSERGAVATEYGLLISGIAAVIVLAIALFGGSVGGLFEDTCSAVEATSQSTC